MAPKDAAHIQRWRIAEVIFGIPLVACIMLQLLVPLSPSVSQALSSILVVSGITLALAGIALIVAARREFAAHRQPTDPGHATSKIMNTGIFRISRNPMYVGALLVFSGIGFAVKSIWFLVMIVPVAVACSLILIRPEERYLSSKFGAGYLNYRASVNRWFGRKRVNRPGHPGAPFR